METGHVVREQAADGNVWNTEPAVVKGAVIAFIGAIGTIAVIGGWITSDEVKTLQDQAGVIIPALFVILSLVQAIWTRASVWSPRSAAQAAVASAERGVPTLPA